jgi:hypothetical protein
MLVVREPLPEIVLLAITQLKPVKVCDGSEALSLQRGAEAVMEKRCESR